MEDCGDSGSTWGDGKTRYANIRISESNPPLLFALGSQLGDEALRALAVGPFDPGPVDIARGADLNVRAAVFVRRSIAVRPSTCSGSRQLRNEGIVHTRRTREGLASR